MDRVAKDITGPFPASIVVQDQFTKWTEAYALPDFTVQTVAKVFVHEFVSRHGAPLEVHTEKGRNFKAEHFQEMCQVLGMHKGTNQQPPAPRRGRRD